MIFKIENTKTVSSLFGEWEETIIYSCLQKVMGDVYADNPDHPTSAAAVLGDFSFFAGKPNTDLVAFKPKHCTKNFMIMVPQTQAWTSVIVQTYKDRANIVSRYATKKEPDIFDKDNLEKAIRSLPFGYEIRMIDEPIYHMCLSSGWCTDLTAQFPDYHTYKSLGLGAVVLKENQPVSGASSYSRYRDGIEIEIDTKEEYRRRGLAFACGAKLILECLKRNLYPSWDSQNKASAALAEKLGYRFSHTYTAVEIREY